MALACRGALSSLLPAIASWRALLPSPLLPAPFSSPLLAVVLRRVARLLVEVAGAASAVFSLAFADESVLSSPAFSLAARTRGVELRVREVAGLASCSELTVAVLSVF